MTTEPTQMPLPLRCRPARRRHHWSDRHLRCCLACGRVWKPRRRKTCPHCHHDRLAFCLTCDRAWPEQNIRDRCTPPCEDLRRLVKAYGGNWKHARGALAAANGDVARALVALQRRKTHRDTPAESAAETEPARPGSHDSIHRKDKNKG